MPALQTALLSLLAALALATATGAAAAELSNLDADMPTAVDDALAAAPGRFELQGAARYDRIHGRDAVQLLPRVQLGVVEGFQVNLALPYTARSSRRSDPGRSGAGGGLLYNLNRERGWLRALSPDEEKRRDRYRVVAGYSQLVASNVVVVLDYVRESQERRERAANIAEAGLRYQFTDAVTLGAGAGAGFGVGRDSPRFRALASIQIGFGGR